MSKNTIKKEYLNKIDELIRHNKLYYDGSNPEISDKDYDVLKKSIIDLENKYKFLKSKNSPSILVGSKPSKSFLKHKHRVKMLSLSNAFGIEDLLNFEKKISNFLNIKVNQDYEYSVEPKIDGISASLTYKNRHLVWDYQEEMELMEK